MLKSKEHVEQRRFSYQSFGRSDASSTSNRESSLSPSALSGLNHSPSPTHINPASDSVAEVVLEKRATGFLDAAGAALGQLSSNIQSFLREQVAPIRLASHLAVLVVATIVVLVSRMDLPAWEFPLHTLPADGLLAESSASDTQLINRDPIAKVGDALQRAVRPFTFQSAEEPAVASADVQSAEAESQANAALSRVDKIQIYKVLPGDHLQKIAARYDLRPETIQWANPALESNPDLLRVGDELIIPPVDGVLHIVRGGDTLSSLAAKYKVTVNEIVAYPLNSLESAGTPINSGKQLIIPNGTKPYVPRQVAIYSGPIPASASRGTGHLGWPVKGQVTQRFWGGHRAVDVGAWTGAQIVAADSGYVVAARHGWNGGYGNMVMIDHGNGFISLYAHMHSIYVRQGESIAKGEQVGTVGNTGRSTGPHLHFEVRYQGVTRNPFNYLP